MIIKNAKLAEIILARKPSAVVANHYFYEKSKLPAHIAEQFNKSVYEIMVDKSTLEILTLTKAEFCR